MREIIDMNIEEKFFHKIFGIKFYHNIQKAEPFAKRSCNAIDIRLERSLDSL